MISIVRERLERRDTEEGFVLEGFPRTVAQAEALDTMVDDRAPLVVIDVEVPEETLVLRLSTRLICSSCGWTSTPGATMCARCGSPLVQRNDDNAEIVRERLRVYGRESQPLVDFYQRRRTFRSVDGDQPQDAVAADISAAVASALGGRQ
jgi:adenylate kinase